MDSILKNMEEHTNSSLLNKQQYWCGISILLSNYHAVNRKLFACIINTVEIIKNGLHYLADETKAQDNDSQCLDKSFLLAQLLQIVNNKKTDYEGFVVHFKCLLKNGKDAIEAKGVIDLLANTYTMTFQSSSMDDFEIKLINNDVEINILKHSDVESSSRWSEFVLKPKLLKWCLNQSQVDLITDKSRINSSLRLIDLEKYNNLYNEFKHKYSEPAMKLWLEAKESTDPLKFIYEDLAIAAYLISLWQSDLVNHPPEAFADLGCGNGLLVYILIQEGYQGYGYDIRSRKLWSLYPPNVTSNLYEQAIEPFKFILPSEVDWLIGNHSDELSPWLPVLAATCHNNMNYFLLPCCAFEFSGSKFQRRNSSISGYKDFCDYAEKISEICGFKTETDRLKIPSTKRIALIGLNRQYTQTEFANKLITIKEFVKNEQKLHPNALTKDIKLREKTESVRNCTQIDKTIIDNLVQKIFFLLLYAKSTDNSSSVDNKEKWQTGGLLTMADIAKNIDKSDLKHIKSECGGLKTLLRNKHEIFEFYPPDFVKIRKPEIRISNSNKPQTIKKRYCFFKEHHPQGCPLTNDECTFVH